MVNKGDLSGGGRQEAGGYILPLLDCILAIKNPAKKRSFAPGIPSPKCRPFARNMASPSLVLWGKPLRQICLRNECNFDRINGNQTQLRYLMGRI